MKQSKIEPPPPLDPRLGDKTPEYVTWLARTNVADWLKRYSGRKILGIWVPPGATEIPAEMMVLLARNPATALAQDLPLGVIPEEPKEEHFTRNKR